jgi:dolichol-phosphate hexosyltransferase
VILLPTLNEEEGLARTLRDLPFDQLAGAKARIQPLVIDGGSTDGTLGVAREWGIPVLRQDGRGKGGAVLEAMAWVHRLGIPFVVALDADATYPTDLILPMLSHLQGGADLVIGVRRPAWGPPSGLKDLTHRLGNVLMSYTASLLTRRPILDLCSGFWGVSTARFMGLGLDDSGFAIEAELVLESAHQGLIIRQIPVPYYERVGQAKLRALRDGSRILSTILRRARRAPHPVRSRPRSNPWGRELLTAALTLGLSDAVPGRFSSGKPYVRAVTPGVRESTLGAPPPGAAGARMGSGSETPAAGSRSLGGDDPRGRSLPLTEAPAPYSPAGPPSGVSAIPCSVRAAPLLDVDLPAGTRPPPDDRPDSPWSRAGGWRARVPRRGSTSPSLLVLVSRLNFDREFQRAALRMANGFRVPESTPYSVELLPVPGGDGPGARP